MAIQLTDILVIVGLIALALFLLMGVLAMSVRHAGHQGAVNV